MYAAEFTDCGIMILAVEACGPDQRAVPNPADYLGPRGLAKVDAGGAVTFTARDQSYAALRELFADETGWVQPG